MNSYISQRSEELSKLEASGRTTAIYITMRKETNIYQVSHLDISQVLCLSNYVL
jgi:hypothetical protein